jgi:hypothetical protein
MLHIVYRSYGGENKKGRPDYYSKHLALCSIVRAFRELAPGQAELIFLNDGPIPAERLRTMKRSGEVLARSNLGLKGSWREALALPVDRRWKAGDVVWFAEDDYLYLPYAFRALIAASEALPQADYFGLYAQIGTRQPNDALPGDDRVPRGWQEGEPVLVQGHPWRRALSTTSTFGARVKPLVEDRRMMQLVMKSGGAWDHTTSLIYQGYRPYPLPSLRAQWQDSEANMARTVGATLVRGALNAYPPLRRLAGVPDRTLVSADPALITHMETAFLSSGTNWQAFAEDMQDWMRIHADM